MRKMMIEEIFYFRGRVVREGGMRRGRDRMVVD
jgi:hypothetical protein